jgi:hypothetical protein
MSPHRNNGKSVIEHGCWWFHDTTSKGLRLSGRRHLIKSEIVAAASADNDNIVSGKRLRHSPIRLQVPAELTVANDLRRLQIYHWRITFIPHRWQIATSRMTTTIIVPINRGSRRHLLPT